MTKRRKWLIAGAAVVLSVVAYVVFYWDIPIAALEVGSATSAYRQAGLPWTEADLQPRLPVTDAENAADLIRQAVAHRPHLPNVHLHGPISPSDVAAYRVALDDLHKAAQKPRVDFHYDWNDFGRMPEGLIFSVVNAAMRRAQLRLSHHDVVGAAQDLLDAFHLSSVLGTVPAVNYLQLSLQFQSELLEVVDAHQTELSANPSVRARLAAELSTWTAPSVKRAVLCDAYTLLVTFRNFKYHEASFDNSEIEVDIKPDQVKRSGLADDMKGRAYMARFCQGWVEIAKKWQGVDEAQPAFSDAVRDVNDEMCGHRQTSYRFSSIMFPFFTGIDARLKDLEQQVSKVQREFKAI